jgi:signal peptidase II
MFYDLVFPYEACMGFNHLPGSGIESDCGYFGTIETRHTGFLFGNVVDMFKFHAFWPEWVPYLGGKQVFPAIWNVSDAAISLGVITIFIRQRKYFPKKNAMKDGKDIAVPESASEDPHIS